MSVSNIFSSTSADCGGKSTEGRKWDFAEPRIGSKFEREPLQDPVNSSVANSGCPKGCDRQPGQMSPISRVQSTPDTSDMTDLSACCPGWLFGEASEGVGPPLHLLPAAEREKNGLNLSAAHIWESFETFHKAYHMFSDGLNPAKGSAVRESLKGSRRNKEDTVASSLCVAVSMHPGKRKKDEKQLRRFESRQKTLRRESNHRGEITAARLNFQQQQQQEQERRRQAARGGTGRRSQQVPELRSCNRFKGRFPWPRTGRLTFLGQKLVDCKEDACARRRALSWHHVILPYLGALGE
ncbi:hypothetical protein E3U43_012659 [Larimichthys crocea]|uniref:Uncharacterized protein n=1 Tax=Larimichthys crocea TaxID=215358 RepID=A0ACD3RSE7_LARCR|nr:hypothetical protein E3U43_012659 [Larimichthys crocea]